MFQKKNIFLLLQVESRENISPFSTIFICKLTMKSWARFKKEERNKMKSFKAVLATASKTVGYLSDFHESSALFLSTK